MVEDANTCGFSSEGDLCIVGAIAIRADAEFREVMLYIKIQNILEDEIAAMMHMATIIMLSWMLSTQYMVTSVINVVRDAIKPQTVFLRKWSTILCWLTTMHFTKEILK